MPITLPPRVYSFDQGQEFLAAFIALLVVGLLYPWWPQGVMDQSIWLWPMMLAVTGYLYVVLNVAEARRRHHRRLLDINPHLAGLRTLRWDERRNYAPDYALLYRPIVVDCPNPERFPAYQVAWPR